MGIIKSMKRFPWILIFIILVGLFFRTYQIVDRFEFGHDGDLYSWIVKDIVINHHPRLIGQLTSAPGIFIGPFFYYLLVPFFLMTNMDPIGALIPATIIGLLTILSYYIVLSKIFKKSVGLIAAFLYAVLITTVNLDRWVVPTISTSLWAIWYLYSLVLLSRGNFSVFPILGILIGLIWHVHIALIPSLIAIPFAIFISKKLPTLKQIINFIVTFFITSIPLILFELRHNSGQTLALINNFTASRDGASGFYKFQLVLEMVTKNLNTLFFSPQSFNFTNNIFFVLLILLLPSILIYKQSLRASHTKEYLRFKDIAPLYVWFVGVIVFFSLSSSPISEYYFTNLSVIFITIVSLIFSLIFKSSHIGKILILIILSIVLFKNAYFLINQSYYNKGYIERKNLVEFVKQDAKMKGFPCMGISYITALGENVGFRYFFYLSKIHLVHPSFDIPVYNIVIPFELSKEVEKKIGHIGLILPDKIPPQETIKKSCQTPDTNLTDPVLGYVE